MMDAARATPESPCIGIFDSGVGGLSVLQALLDAAPPAHAPRLVYVADSGHAPYGERDDDFVKQRALAIAGFLRAQGAALIVVACNTATALAVEALRRVYADLAIVGVEPGLKPAAAATRNGRIGVLATAATLRSARFRALAHAHAGSHALHLQACPGLAQAIESGDIDGPAVRQLVQQFCEPLHAAQVDTVVLGCTHYPFVARHLQAALGSAVALIDTAPAVARQALKLCPGAAPASSAALELFSSGDKSHLAAIASRWLGRPCRADVLTV